MLCRYLSNIFKIYINKFDINVRQDSHDYICLPLSGLGDHNRHVNCRQHLPHEYMSIHICMCIGAHNRYVKCMYIPLVPNWLSCILCPIYTT